MTDFFTRKITMSLLRGKIEFEEAQRAFKDPEAYKAEQKQRSLIRNRADGASWPGRYSWWGKVSTPRMTLAYCWSKVRNTEGYFLGWREVYEPGKTPVRDQFVARKTKRRLKELQWRRTAAIKSKWAKNAKS